VPFGIVRLPSEDRKYPAGVVYKRTGGAGGVISALQQGGAQRRGLQSIPAHKLKAKAYQLSKRAALLATTLLSLAFDLGRVRTVRSGKCACVEGRHVNGLRWLDVLAQGGGTRGKADLCNLARAFKSSSAMIAFLRRSGGDDVVKAGRRAALFGRRRLRQVVDLVPGVLGRPVLVDVVERIGWPFLVDVVEGVVWLGVFLLVALSSDGRR
jgi:hypothetical protein